MEITSNSTQETNRLAEKLAKKTKPGDVFALYGNLGSGKTTFTNFLVKALGFDSRVQSPTFVIIRTYNKNLGKIRKVYHVDLYRLTRPEELDDLGWEEMFEEEDAVVIIEWPEFLEENLPKGVKKLRFTYVDENTRKIDVQDQN